MDLPLTHCWNLESAETTALLDTGAEGLFVDNHIARRKRRLLTPLRVRNVDGSNNRDGLITHETRIKFRLGNESFDEWFYITKLGDQTMILGMPWFKRNNPLIDWRKQSIEAFNWTKDKQRYDTIMAMIRYIGSPIDEPNMEDSWEAALLYLDDADFIPIEEVWVRAKTSVATQLAQDAYEHQEKVVLPEYYQKYEKVFRERESGKMPNR